MRENEILEEIYGYREQYAKSFNYDLQAIVDDLRKKQAASGRQIISTPLKQPSRTNKEFWHRVKSTYQLGKLIYGKVEAHKPFGVFVDIGDAEVKGLIQITDFVDTGLMTPEMYPDIGSPVGAVVVGYTEDKRNQIWLSVKPSVLQKSLVKLKIAITNQP